MRKAIAAFLGLLMASSVWAATAIVQGRVAHEPGASITLLKLDDGISGKRTVLARTQSDDYGNFFMEVEINAVTTTFLHVNGVVSTLYLAPDGVYNVTIPMIERKDPRTFNDMKVDLEFERGNAQNINLQVAGFNRQYEFFFKEFLPDLVEARYAGSSSYVRSNRERLSSVNLLPAVRDSLGDGENEDFLMRIDNFKVIQAKTLSEERSNPWMADYIDYALATTEVSAGRSKQEIYARYFEGRPVQWDHPEYITALDQLYQGWLQAALDNDSLPALYNAVMRDRDAVVLDEVCAALPMLKVPEVRSVVLLTNLKHMYYQGRRDKRIPLRVLEDMAAHPEHFGRASAVAEHLVKRMTFGKIGTAAPEFVYRNVQGDMVELSSFEGRFVYVQVFSKWCRNCETQMEVMRPFYRKYQREAEIISISMDPDFQTFTNFYDDHDFDWMFGYGPADATFQDKFQLTSIPQYFIIDPDGNWAAAHVGAPDEGGLGEVERLILKWRNDHQGLTKPYMGR